MFQIVYDPMHGTAIPDGRADAWVLEHWAKKPVRAVVSTANVIDATRALIYLGRIPPTEVVFIFGGQEIHPDRDGRLPDWPAGFCDYVDNWLGILMTPRTQLEKRDV